MDVIHDNDHIKGFFGDISPFNPKKDKKYLSDKKINFDKVLREIEAVLFKGMYEPIYKKNELLMVIKFRIKDLSTNKGKSSGFRVIIILDKKIGVAFILNVYPKTGSNRKDNLTREEKQKLLKLCDRYFESIHMEGN